MLESERRAPVHAPVATACGHTSTPRPPRASSTARLCASPLSTDVIFLCALSLYNDRFLSPLITSTDPPVPTSSMTTPYSLPFPFLFHTYFTLVIPRFSYPYRAGSPKLPRPRLLHFRCTRVPFSPSHSLFYFTCVVLYLICSYKESCMYLKAPSGAPNHYRNRLPILFSLVCARPLFSACVCNWHTTSRPLRRRLVLRLRLAHSVSFTTYCIWISVDSWTITFV